MLVLRGKTLCGVGSVSGRLCYPTALSTGARIVVVESAEELAAEELSGTVGVVLCSGETAAQARSRAPVLAVGNDAALRTAVSLGSVAILDARRGRLIIDPDVDAVNRCLRALRRYRT